MSQKLNEGKGVIFDLDGTLLDSMGVWDDLDAESLAKRGIEIPDDFGSTVASMQFRDIAVYTIARFGLDDTPEELMQEWNDMAAKAYATTVQLKRHAAEYLRYLRESGATLAVATTLPPELRNPALEHAGITDYFNVICSVDDAGGKGKEHPDVYLHAAELLGVAPAHCTVFEDLLVGISTAKSIGMHPWAMFDASSERQWQDISALAEGAIHDFSDAPRELR
ncbi:HAD family hydrolase [Bifidobacterium crudilactis]|jgi:HAD superfamily hydrolase (TIGR01509 family)|uniref:HAD family phosphatase n=1 Tax=Bifidobacterium crudilactis TaxID=327277 RepID=A0A971D132_9BIFI|nr:HAD family phosphatase [Bifidobacterium crudilactis]MCI1868004.1 HAD family phosphatase [Bifidobacterium crudilactis]NLT80502.1 HAD family phosphatase [Bifidobacterium crudilactis]